MTGAPLARRMLPAVLLVSAAAIGYEILLMRLLAIVQWHHFAWMIISLALLGYGASGTAIALLRSRLEGWWQTAFAVSALLFSITAVAGFGLGQRIPFNALAIVWDPQQFLHLTALYALFMVPFFFAATCLGLAFTFRGAQAGRIYRFDLIGAGTGALLIIGLLFVLAPQHALPALVLLPLVASVLSSWQTAHRRWLRTGQAVWLVIVAVLVAGEPLALRMSPYKGLSQALEVTGAGAVAEYSSPLGLLTVVASPRIPFRHAPGLSLATGHVPPEQLAVFTDGDAMSVLTRVDGDPASLGYLGDMTAALPYQILHRPRVLSLGAGAGSDVLLALHHGARAVDAVELNPQMVALVREDFAGFSGGLYNRESVHAHIAEARSFAARSADRYDLVQVGLLDSFGVAGSGVQALNESYLYTVEAVGDYLERLAPDGLLTMTRWLRLPPRDSLKLAATVITALREAGVAEPERHLAVIRSWNTVTLLAAKAPFTPAQIRAVWDFAGSRSFDVAWAPGMTARAANRYNQLDRAHLFEGIRALLGDNARQFMDRYKFRIEPATDERPYFFQFFKWRVLPEVMRLRERGGASLIEWGYLVLVATLVQAVVFGGLLIMAPLAWHARRWPRTTGRTLGGYFFLLGLAFLFIEISFIQKFILFLGHPLYAVAAVLSGFLVFAGLGSGLSPRWTAVVAGGGRSPVTVAVLAIASLALSYLLILPSLLDAALGLPIGLRLMLALVCVAPLAFFMGLPFPLGLSRISAEAPDFVPWAWGLNGFASVISAALATLVAIAFGFSTVVICAAGLYAAAAWLYSRDPVGTPRAPAG